MLDASACLIHWRTLCARLLPQYFDDKRNITAVMQRELDKEFRANFYCEVYALQVHQAPPSVRKPAPLPMIESSFACLPLSDSYLRAADVV